MTATPKSMADLKWKLGDRVAAVLPDGRTELIDPMDLANVQLLADLRAHNAKLFQIPRKMLEPPPIAPILPMTFEAPRRETSIEWTAATMTYRQAIVAPPRFCYFDMEGMDTPEELEAQLNAIEARIASDNRARLEAVELVISMVRCVLAGFAHDQWRAEMARESVETLVEIMIVCGRLTGSPIELDIDSKPAAPSDGGALGLVFELFPIEID